jgi:hypothetical protein
VQALSRRQLGRNDTMEGLFLFAAIGVNAQQTTLTRISKEYYFSRVIPNITPKKNKKRVA